MERNHGVFGLEFPEHPGGETQESNDEGGNDMGLLPEGGATSGEGEGDEEASEGGNEENDANDIELPEEGREN